MDAHEAAQAVFPALARSLQKYLRVTRQQPRHTAEQVVRHLAHCLSFDMSPKAFLERFFANYPTMDVRMDIQTSTHFMQMSCSRYNRKQNGRSYRTVWRRRRSVTR
jgi:hypothetical protein